MQALKVLDIVAEFNTLLPHLSNMGAKFDIGKDTDGNTVWNVSSVLSTALTAFETAELTAKQTAELTAKQTELTTKQEEHKTALTALQRQWQAKLPELAALDENAFAVEFPKAQTTHTSAVNTLKTAQAKELEAIQARIAELSDVKTTAAIAAVKTQMGWKQGGSVSHRQSKRGTFGGQGKLTPVQNMITDVVVYTHDHAHRYAAFTAELGKWVELGVLKTRSETYACQVAYVFNSGQGDFVQRWERVGNVVLAGNMGNKVGEINYGSGIGNRADQFSPTLPDNFDPTKTITTDQYLAELKQLTIARAKKENGKK